MRQCFLVEFWGDLWWESGRIRAGFDGNLLHYYESRCAVKVTANGLSHAYDEICCLF